ncbi:MAG: efflux RND transporter periplasmic adaptor subunit [Proteobacteria bacterium]|nr:MAG: efflux RND transporter periplasmic adaptor subunit [Pseudomonadota bacterium]
MFKQLKFCNIFFGLLLLLPLNGIAATVFKTPISLSGVIEPAETLKVQASSGGRIITLHVKENQRVTMGQLLLTLKNDSQKRQLELSRIQIKINENNVQDLETNLRDIQRRLKEEKTLFEQGSSTRSQFDSLKLQYSRGEISLNNAKLTLERSQQELAMSMEAMDDTQLFAKIGGIIVGKSVEEGEIISPGAVLFQIIDMNKVEIRILVEEEDLPMIREGQSVVFTTPSYRNKEFPGKVERISWTSDPETGLFPLYLKATNPALKLRAGMSVKVYLLKKK